MNDIDARSVKSAARTYRQRFGAKARAQAAQRARELEALRSGASVFWWAVVSELEESSTNNLPSGSNADQRGC